MQNYKTREMCKNGTCFKVNVQSSLFCYFWEKLYINWEESTFTIFDRFLNSKSSYLDVGAWIGPTILYGAQKAGHAYAIEPDPVAYQELTRNLQLNPSLTSKVTCINSALTTFSGTKRLYIREFMGDSSSSILPTLSDKYFTEVSGITIEELNFLENITFIKMDIEAGEYSLIPAMREYLEKRRPTLYLSLHPPFLEESLNLTKYKDSYSEAKVLKLTKRLLESLSFYKFIYDSNGNLVNSSIILKERSFCSFLFTDESW